MTKSIYRGWTIKCSISNHHQTLPPIFALKPAVQKLEKSAVKTVASKAIKTMDPLKVVVNGLVDSMYQFVDQTLLPSQKNFAPVEEIGGLVQVHCSEGEVPADFLEGIYIRNGGNPLFGGLKSSESVFGKTYSVWVEGEGMLHALYFIKDRAGDWMFMYNNRYVETETYKMESQRKKPAFIPTGTGDPLAALAAAFFNTLRFGEVNKILSNTSVFEHGGKYYSVTENYLPQEIDLVSLETHGNWNPGGAWSRSFTPHPKRVPGTGELVTVGYDAKKPYGVVGVISADGKELLHRLDLQLDRCTVFHEVGVTERYNVLIDHLLTIDVERVVKGGQLFEYETQKKARIAVIPRYGGLESIKWFPIEPCCAFHLLNCFEEGDEVVVRGCRASAAIYPGPKWEDAFDWFSRGFNFNPANGSHNTKTNGITEDGMLFTSVREWRLNLKTSEVKERDISGSDFSMDFPMINVEFTGLKHKYGYTQVIDSVASSTSAKTKYGGLAKLYLDEEGTKQETAKVKMEYHWLPKNNFCTGAAFVAKEEAMDEDDGWIITFAHDEDADLSYVLLVDAKKFGGEPVAKIVLPQRVPYGHHGSFFHLSKQELDIINGI